MDSAGDGLADDGRREVAWQDAEAVGRLFHARSSPSKCARKYKNGEKVLPAARASPL